MSLLDESVNQALLAARIVGARNSYKADNKVEASAVLGYLQGGPRPASVATAMGKHLIALEDARRAGYAPPIVTPPAATFGANLANPFPEITGTVQPCSTWAQLQTALAAGGVVRIDAMIRVPDGVYNATAAKPETYVFAAADGCGITNGRFLVQASNVRLRGLQISSSLYDGVKVADNNAVVANVDIDGCWIHDVGDQGVLSGNGVATDVWVRNCLIERVGQTPNPGVTYDGHCIYTGGAGAKRWTIINNLLRPKSYGVQLYGSVQPTDCVVAGNTCDHAELLGLAYVAGTGHRLIGNVCHDGPGGVIQGNPAGCEAWGNVWWNMGGGYRNGYTGTIAGDGGLQQTNTADVVPKAQWGWLPSTFRNGTRRVTADAGCGASQPI